MSSNQTNYYALIQIISEGFSALKNASYSELQILEIVPNNYSKQFTVSPNVRFNIIILCPNPQNLQLTFFDESGNISFQPFTITSPLLLKFENENFSNIVLNDPSGNQVLLAYSVVSFASPEDAQFAKPNFDLESLPYGSISLNANQNINIQAQTPTGNWTPVRTDSNSYLGIAHFVNGQNIDPRQVGQDQSGNPKYVPIDSNNNVVKHGIYYDQLGLSKTLDYGQQGIIVQPCTSLTNSTTYTSASPVPTLALNGQYWNPPILSATFTPNPNTVHYRWGFFFPAGLDLTAYQSFRLFLWCMSSNPNSYGNTYVVFKDWYGSEAYVQLNLTNSANTYQFNLSSMTNINGIQQALIQYILLDFDSNSSSQIQQTFVTRNWTFFGNVGQMQDPTFSLQNSLSNQQIPIQIQENWMHGFFALPVSSINFSSSNAFMKITIVLNPGDYIEIEQIFLHTLQTSANLLNPNMSDDIGLLNAMWSVLQRTTIFVPPSSEAVIPFTFTSLVVPNGTTSAYSSELFSISGVSISAMTINYNRIILNNTTSQQTYYIQIAYSGNPNAPNITNGLTLGIKYRGVPSNQITGSYNTGSSSGTGGSGGGGGGGLKTKIPT
jgi:hypothetical protein